MSGEMTDNAPRFNLIDEPWIPVRHADGRIAELGLREVLLTANSIAEIQDASPLVVAALHRFLLAVLYRALEGPTDRQQAKAWFKDGLPLHRIDDYLSRWRDRFWLFHSRYPFAQIPDYEPTKWHAWTVLAAEHNASNAKVLFDHTDVAHAGSIPAAQAARWLLAAQSFALGGGNSDFGYTKSAPSATAVMALPIGRSLADTLLFCLVPQNRAVAEGDIPIWEREPESVATLKSGRERSPAGFADLYTWRTRSVRLQPDHARGIESLAFASGVGSTSTAQIDPMVGYRVDEKHGRLPLIFRARGLWRDFDSLLPDAADCAPKVVEHAIFLGSSAPVRFPTSIIAAGQANDKAKIEYWRMERFALPVKTNDLRSEIHALLAYAEEAQTSLWLACKSFARDLLSRGEREPAGKDVTNFLRQMTVIDSYWSTLEARFHEVLREYTEERDFEDIRHGWLISVRSALSAAWSAHRASVSTGDAWAIRALAKAERPVRHRLGSLSEVISKLAPEKEPV